MPNVVCYYARRDGGACCCVKRPDGRYVAVYDSEMEVVSPRVGRVGKNSWVLAFTDEKLCGDKSADTAEMRALSRKRGWMVISIYAYVHSGKTIFSFEPVYPFNCPFDAFCCGYAFVRLTKFGRRADAARIRKALHALREELGALSAWLNGEVYDVVLFDGENPIKWDIVVGFEQVKPVAEKLFQSED